jgi:DNA primase
MMAIASGQPFSSVLALWHQIKFNYRTIKKESVDRHLELPKGVNEMQEAHRAYLRDRKFDPDVIANLWGVKGIGIAARMAWRLFIPIHDAEGMMVAWTTRSLNPNADLRYITSKEEQSEVDVKSLLYGEHLVQDSVIVNEGPIDAWAWGYGGVATLGVAYTDIQVARIVKYPLRAICFDSTPDAQRRAEALCRQLSAFPGDTHNILLESGKDPASADFEEISEIKRFVGLI